MKNSGAVLIGLLVNVYSNLLYSQISNNKAEDQLACDKIKFDTVINCFVKETNVFHGLSDAIIQQGLIFPNFQNEINVKKMPSLLYKYDSVYIYVCNATPYCAKIFRTCSNQKKMSYFDFLFSKGSMSKERLERYNASEVKTREGVNYVEFFSSLVVTDLGKQKLLIPKIFSSSCESNFEQVTYCEKEFSHVFLIIDFLEFNYKKSSIKE